MNKLDDIHYVEAIRWIVKKRRRGRADTDNQYCLIFENTIFAIYIAVYVHHASDNPIVRLSESSPVDSCVRVPIYLTLIPERRLIG